MSENTIRVWREECSDNILITERGTGDCVSVRPEYASELIADIEDTLINQDEQTERTSEGNTSHGHDYIGLRPLGCQTKSTQTTDMDNEHQSSSTETDHPTADHRPVKLHRELDVGNPEQSERRLYNTMSELYADNFETFVLKNQDYGSSFLTAGRIDQEMGDGTDPFDGSVQGNLFKLWTRIQDKNQRFYRLAFCDRESFVSEKIGETARDAANYWLMVAYLAEEVAPSALEKLSAQHEEPDND